jgi:hypothetical protein
VKWDIEVLKEKKVSYQERMEKSNEEMTATELNVSSRIGQLQ